MLSSRLVTASLVLLLAAACSSSSSTAVSPDAGVPDATTGTDTAAAPPPGADATRPPVDATKDHQTTLGIPDATQIETSVTTEAGFSDARPDIAVEATTCVPDASAAPGPVKHVCIIYPAGGDDDNECDGHHDPPAPFPANGATGNGFDDNCNGLVDEGCACDAVGTTKTCYLVPATQTVDGAPVGWCAQNSKGTVACAQQGEGGPTWSGQCRGAQPPYATDFCAPGDFNCDGVAENSTTENCSCTSGVIQCPSDPLTTVPYPPASALPLEVNAASWFVDPADVPNATDWQWTLTGGDCDDILPHPTFGIYATSDGTGNPIGTQENTLGASGNEHGVVATQPAVTSSIYPAFSLSGDYLLGASWTLNGKAYSCSLKVQVRAPGRPRPRGAGAPRGKGTISTSTWRRSTTSPSAPRRTAGATSPTRAPRPTKIATTATATPAAWAATRTRPTGATRRRPHRPCTGWGSQTTGATSCNNPRLDRDANGLSGTCDPTVTNPNTGMNLFTGSGGFCGPENINVDHPANNDRFAVGLRFFTQNAVPPVAVSSHVVVYCDGARVLSAGYDPTTGQDFPKLVTAGADSAGDMWKVGIVQASVTGAGLTCAVVPTQSTTPDPMRDGSSAYCVDDASLDGATSQDLLTSSGLEPANANSLCYH